ncbi:MAG: type II toxin-antitoxin system RelE/ParE family toxin [Saprospiraceae bacterium]
MDIKWTIPALDALKEHYNYLKSKRGIEPARKFRKKLFTKVGILKTYPRVGVEEKSLFFKDKEYRSLIESHLKLIYRVEENEILIIDVFDMRQNPDKLIF